MTSRKPSVSIRRPPTTDPGLVEQFVAGGAREPASANPSAASDRTSGTPAFRVAGTLGSQTSTPLDVQEPGRPEARDSEHRGVPALEVPASQASKHMESRVAGSSAVRSPEPLGIPVPANAMLEESGRSAIPAPEGLEPSALGRPGVRHPEPPNLRTSGRADLQATGGPDAGTAGVPSFQTSAPERACKRPAEAQSREPGAAPPTPAATRRGLVHRQDGRVRRRMTVYLPPELVGALTAFCVYDGRELSEAITDAIRTYLERT